MVLRRARAILRNDAEASDVVQDVFLSLMERGGVKPGSGIVSMLYIATTRRCLNRMRNAQRRSSHDQRRVYLMNDDGQEVASGLVLTREILSTLDEDEATALILSAVDGMSTREIGEALGCSHTHAGTLVNRALAAARTGVTP